MTNKIAELIEIKSAYSTQVNLREEYSDDSVNIERMERYMPIRSHRDAFEKIANGLIQKDNKRFYLLTGSYGTGKSHLCLMAANYLSTPSNTPEIEAFFNNFKSMAEEDKENTSNLERLKSVRKNKKFLVCICDYDSNDSFMEIILKSILSALTREGIDSRKVESPYKEAIRKIKEWSDYSDQSFFNRFKDQLSSKLPGTTVNQFIMSIEKNLDTGMLEVFKEIHKNITTVDFVFDKNNLVDIVKEITSSNYFNENFSGIAIIFDEFDYVLKSKRFDLHIFQSFGEYCAKSFLNNAPVIMLATGHRSFVSYKNHYNDEDFSVVSNRVEEISLLTEGFEDIIAAIVLPKKDSLLWNEYITPNRQIFDTLTHSCIEYGIFEHLKGSPRKLRKKIVENIYPMHPMATYVLLEISKQIGSNNRSVFTFFTQHRQKGSYNWFIDNFDIVNENNNLNFYTVDFVLDYFGDLISSDNKELTDTVKNFIRNYESSLREWKKVNLKNKDLKDDLFNENEKLVEKILKTLVLFNISNIVTNEENILFGLNANAFEDQKRKIKSLLNYLVKNQVLYYNRQTTTYEFRKSDIIDVNSIIEDYVSKEENFNINVTEELYSLGKVREYQELYKAFKEEFLEGKSYNRQWNEDKRFLRKFVTINDIESSKFYHNLADNFNKETYEGLAIICICETKDECERAKEIAKTNKNLRIIVGVPSHPLPIKENMVRYLGTKTSFDYDQLSEQEKTYVKDKRNSIVEDITSTIKQYSSDSNLNWFGSEGLILGTDTRYENQPVSLTLERIYDGKRTRIKQSDINKVHSNEKTALKSVKDAVNRLLNMDAQISWDTQKSEDTADIRYFKKVLHAGNVLNVIESNETINIGKINKDKQKFEENIPVLSRLFEEIDDNHRGVSVKELIDICDEYGAGEVAKSLYISIIIRYFSGSLFVKKSSNGDFLSLKNYEDFHDVFITKNYSNAIVEIIEFTDDEINLINNIYGVFENITLNENITVEKCFNVLRNWYESLPAVCKVKNYYDNEQEQKLIDVFSTMNSVPPQTFILVKLQTIIGSDESNMIDSPISEEIVNILQLAKLTMPKTILKVKEIIYQNVLILFENTDVPTFKDKDLEEALVNWFESLTEVQKDISNPKHNSESRELVSILSNVISVQKTLLEDIPTAFDLQCVHEWKVDKLQDLIVKLRYAKKHTEENVVDVEDPDITFDSSWLESIENNEKVYYFKEGSYLTISVPKSHIVLQCTFDGSNPKNVTGAMKIKDSLDYFPDFDQVTLKVVSKDHENRYGNVRIYKLRASKLKFAAQKKVKEQQLGYSFDNELTSDLQVQEDYIYIPGIPHDDASLELCIGSVIDIAKKEHGVDDREIFKVLNRIIKRMQDSSE
ncbi:hypothetical protein ACFFGV_20245 [Pontibacillus salicampi]|uniref:ATP-binding protein n=1 Tax=Pontibacillus salicampi TaxID=1449801 RepID=A0ABV6LU24_9BACI